MFHPVCLSTSVPPDVKPEELMDTSHTELVNIKQEGPQNFSQEADDVLVSGFESDPKLDLEPELQMETSQPEVDSIVPLETKCADTALSIEREEDDEVIVPDKIPMVPERVKRAETPSISDYLDADAKLRSSVVRLTDVITHMMDDKSMIKELEENFLMDTKVDIKKELEDPDFSDTNITYDLVGRVKLETRNVKTEPRIKQELDSDELTEVNPPDEPTEENSVADKEGTFCSTVSHKENLKFSKEIVNPPGKLITNGRQLRSRLCIKRNPRGKIKSSRRNAHLREDRDSDWRLEPQHTKVSKNKRKRRDLSQKQVDRATETFKSTKVQDVEDGGESSEVDEFEESIQNTVICSVCKGCYTKAKLREHLSSSKICGDYRKNYQKPTGECKVCGKRMKLSLLADHLNIHTNERPYECAECGNHYASRYCLQIHIKKIHGNAPNKFLCTYCGKEMRKKGTFLAHEARHRLALEGKVMQRPFHCATCGRTYVLRKHLTYHLSDAHRECKCEVCDKVFPSRVSMRLHKIKEHQPAGVKHECVPCGKVFRHSIAFKAHMYMVHDTRQLFCDVCNKEFKKKHHLQQHMITHSDARPISCHDCGATFKRKTHLKQHMASAH